MAKKKNTQKPPSVRAEVEPFELRAPMWCIYVCLAVTVGCAIALIAIWCKSADFKKLTDDIVGWSVLLFLIMAAGAVGLYMCLYEKMTFCEGIYAYYKPFKKNQFARVEEIKLAELITVEVWGSRGIRTHYKVFFYGDNDEILLNFLDDGHFFHNETFRESLRKNRIKCKNKKTVKENL